MTTSLSNLSKPIEELRETHPQIILVTGVFDILHQEHIKFLTAAKDLGGALVVGLESDSRVTQIKGEGRPINTATVRMENLERLKIADFVFVLPDQFSRPEDHERLIEIIRPDYLAVSSHTKHLEAKDKILKKYGGCVSIVLQHNPDVSTTKIIEQRTAHDTK